MPENVALTKKKQKSFSNSVEKTKDKIKKGDIKIQAKSPRRFKRLNKGVIYLSNIPHGFYEKELKSYFDQFGDVLKVRVARSKKTGNSKGHAFIKFKEQAVAKIAAETMNNYLMGKRLLKSQLLPYDKKTKALFKKPNFSKEHYPTKVRRLRFKKSFNAAITEDTLKKSTKKALKHIKDVTDKLKKAGIDYDFTPANMPKTIPELKEVEDDFDDSSSDDIIFTPPEKMNSSSEELVIKTDANNKRKSNKKETNDSPKKVKKNASVSIVSTKQIKQHVKEKKNKNKLELASEENNVNNTNDTLKKEKQKKNKNNVGNKSVNEISKEENKKVKKEKKHKNKDSSNSASADNSSNENKENMKKSSKRKQKIVENTENIANESKENIKKSPKYKQKKIENTENSINENRENIKKEAKEKKGDKKIKKLNESIDEIKSSVAQGPVLKKKKNKVNVEGITKKSKKVQKISDKKASLIKGLIQTNDQVQTVKKIEKKKKKTKINQS